MYLTRAAVKATLDAVHGLSADGSQIAHDMWFLVDEPGPLGSARRAAPGALSLIGEPVTFGVHPEDYDALLHRHGFAILDLAMASELQARYAPQSQAVLDDSMYVLTAERISSERAAPSDRERTMASNDDLVRLADHRDRSGAAPPRSRSTVLRMRTTHGRSSS